MEKCAQEKCVGGQVDFHILLAHGQVDFLYISTPLKVVH